MNHPPLRFHITLFIAMAIWGSSFVAMKMVVSDLSPLVAVFLRMSISLVAFAVLIRWVIRDFRYHPGDWKLLLATAAMEPCLYFIFESLALQYTSASQAGMVSALLPLMVAVSAWWLFDENVVPRQWGGFALALAGVLWMTLGGSQSEQAPNPLLGNFLELLAMVAATGYTLLIKHLTQRYSALFLTALQSVIGCLFFLPLALLSPWPDSIGWSTWAPLIYLGVVVTLGGYGLYNYSLGHVKATVAAGYVNLIPAFGVVFSVWLLGDQLTLGQWAGIGLIFAGVYLSREQRRRPEPIASMDPPPVSPG
ncbi:EamA family transporter [Bacterioplanes sanyensis]|uniref:EamA family transporter n=1 Tax=Bacterioplanes sanyensis TaxID=1249553 RepID=A0A222FNZ1_9GAMM|nr:DMT family transporter [Bacterioplanes sanyensis]ASP40432.1 EamA family transporter [Bacterioplanes sanyensis]